MANKGPLIFGVVAMTGLIGYLTLHRSSPGDLSRAHNAIAGKSLITDCNKCHTKEGLTHGCLSCHSEIKKQLSEAKGYHGYLMEGKKAECGSCHSEHNGKDFSLINKVSWQNQDLKKFVHPQANFKLKGKHTPLECGECHNKKYAAPFNLPPYPKLKRETTFLGLSQDCRQCHEDVHAHGLSPDCQKCHGQNSWKPAQGFNHDKFYPLRKGHLNVACYKCHVVPKSRDLMSSDRWAPFDRVQGKTCQECHKTPHRTNWNTACQTCHTQDAAPWSKANTKLTPLHHEKTGFKLSQPHNKTECRECHNVNYKYAQKYPDPKEKGYDRGQKSCEGCHQDAHGGQFLKKYPRCATCHGLLGFIPVRFTTKDHEIYPLEGGHSAAACNMCHNTYVQKGIRRYLGVTKTCAECHEDIHGGQFKVKGTTRCENCHISTMAWERLSFNHNTQSRFKLDKAHERVQCFKCHPSLKLRNGDRRVVYKPLKMKCKDCHRLDNE